jgi:hypothetical protein
VLATSQVVLYFAAFKWEGLFYFDPRIGLVAFGEMLGPYSIVLQVVRWMSPFWILALAIWGFNERRPVRLYMFSEMVLACPSVLFFLLVLWANMGLSHGFSVGELLIPLMMFSLFTISPLMVAWRLLRSLAP